ncbi:MAG: hypothetical protein JSW58_04950 [Candidatus Latescibacterota bacterium]|nr:MAG: hypothetical protein JSW58_04950 [Candidatus Latescibacterota bacterium]
MGGLHEAGVADELIAGIQGDLAELPVTAKDLALLQLAERLTTDVASSAESTRAAREAGWSESEVANAIFIVSYFNMVTRIAEAFALPPDENHPYDPQTKLPMIRCRE